MALPYIVSTSGPRQRIEHLPRHRKTTPDDNVLLDALGWRFATERSNLSGGAERLRRFRRSIRFRSVTSSDDSFARRGHRPPRRRRQLQRTASRERRRCAKHRSATCKVTGCDFDIKGAPPELQLLVLSEPPLVETPPLSSTESIILAEAAVSDVCGS